MQGAGLLEFIGYGRRFVLFIHVPLFVDRTRYSTLAIQPAFRSLERYAILAIGGPT